MNYQQLPENGNSVFDEPPLPTAPKGVGPLFYGLSPTFLWLLTLYDPSWGGALAVAASVLTFGAPYIYYLQGATDAYRYAMRRSRRNY